MEKYVNVNEWNIECIMKCMNHNGNNIEVIQVRM